VFNAFFFSIVVLLIRQCGKILSSWAATEDNMARAYCMLGNENYTHTHTHAHAHTHTHRMCNSYCFSTATMAARTRLYVKLYYMACLVIVMNPLYPIAGSNCFLLWALRFRISVWTETLPVPCLSGVLAWFHERASVSLQDRNVYTNTVVIHSWCSRLNRKCVCVGVVGEWVSEWVTEWVSE